MFLLLIFVGATVGWLIYRPRFHRGWDIVMGVLGTLSGSALISAFSPAGSANYNWLAFFLCLAGAVATVHLGRAIQGFPRN